MSEIFPSEIISCKKFSDAFFVSGNHPSYVIFVENFMGGPTTGMALRRIFRMAGSLSWHRLQRNYISGEDGITGEGGKISPKE